MGGVLRALTSHNTPLKCMVDTFAKPSRFPPVSANATADTTKRYGSTTTSANLSIFPTCSGKKKSTAGISPLKPVNRKNMEKATQNRATKPNSKKATFYFCVKQQDKSHPIQ